MTSSQSPQEILAAGDSHIVGANEPILFENNDRVWWIAAGSLDLFVQRREGSGDWGARLFVHTLETGDLLLPIASGDKDPELLWSAIPAPDTKLIGHAGRELPAASLLPLLESAVEALTHALRGDSQPDQPEDLRPEEGLEWPEGQILRSSSGVSWISLTSGEAELDSLLLIPEFPAFPLSPDTALQAKQASRIELPDPSSLETATLWAGWDRLGSYLARCANRLLENREKAIRDRIEQRTEADRNVYQQSFDHLAHTFERQQSSVGSGVQLQDPLLAACQEIGQAAQIEIDPNLQALKRPSRQTGLERISRLCRFRYRQVTLGKHWYRQEGGPLLGFDRDTQAPIALLPASGGSYRRSRPLENRSERVDASNADEILPTAFTFYRPLPSRAVTIRDLLRFTLSRGSGSILGIIALGLVVSLIGLALPVAMGMLTSSLIPSGSKDGILILVLLLFALNLGSLMIGLVRNLVSLRFETRSSYEIQAAVLDRLLSLPSTFFRKYQTGDLLRRALGVEAIRSALSQTVISTILNGLFSLVYLGQMLYYSTAVALWGFILALVSSLITVVASLRNLTYQRRLLDTQGKLSSLSIEVLNGIQKVRVSASESRVFARWADRFQTQVDDHLASSVLNINSSTLLKLITPIGTGILFYLFTYSDSQELTLGVYFTATAAFGAFFSAFSSLATSVIPLMNVRSIYDRLRPIMEEAPEIQEKQADPGVLDGAIHLSHVSFRYGNDSPNVLSDLEFKIHPGEFVAVVGTSGAGKSTLMRLLLGLDHPTQGDVLYNDVPLRDLDLQEVRRQIGVVLQDSKIFPTSILENIRGSSLMTMEEVVEATRLAGLDQDIQKMPMGLFTMVSDTTLSGGQRQRLLIAQALSHRPKILFFDEATSALDNATQALISRNIEQLEATRVVIAHRLSTIRNADRILVLHQGRIVQAGTFDELMSEEGHFKELAARQMA